MMHQSGEYVPQKVIDMVPGYGEQQMLTLWLVTVCAFYLVWNVVATVHGFIIGNDSEDVEMAEDFNRRETNPFAFGYAGDQRTVMGNTEGDVNKARDAHGQPPVANQNKRSTRATTNNATAADTTATKSITDQSGGGGKGGWFTKKR